MYRYLIFDADHTLIDFDADERRAFAAAFAAAGKRAEEGAIEDCWAFSARNWNDLGLNDVHLPEVQKNYHGMYRSHVRTLFDYVERTHGLNGRREEAEQAFMDELTKPSCPVEGALEAAKQLSLKYRICIATNGLAEMQRGRLVEFAPFLHRVFISEELGCIKPSASFFRIVLGDLGAAAGECLMIGDSISSDVVGANAAGMDCIWFNRRGGTLPQGSKAVEIKSLEELLNLL